METYSASLAICAGNSPVTGEFPAQRPVTRSFDVFFDLRLNTRLSKQSWGWWFETSSGPLWRHCNDIHIYITWTWSSLCIHMPWHLIGAWSSAGTVVCLLMISYMCSNSTISGYQWLHLILVDHMTSFKTAILLLLSVRHGNIHPPSWTASQRTHDAITSSLLRQNDVATSFWRNNDVIITSRVPWDERSTMVLRWLFPHFRAETETVIQLRFSVVTVVRVYTPCYAERKLWRN